MRAPARHSADDTSGYFDSDDDFAFGTLSANERITPIRGYRGGSPVLRVYLAALVLIGGGWIVVRHQEQVQPWLASATAAIGPLLERARSVIEQATTATDQSAASPAAGSDGAGQWAAKLEPLPSSEVATAPGAAATPPAAAAPPQAPSAQVAAHDPAAAEPPTSTADAAPADSSTEAQPLPPPPAADTLTPYQKRASAVGLNPDLSKVLLQRLSSADYRNAGVAIRTALAKTPDDGVFVWPRQRKPELALFEVHFVPGAAPSCRRYVVTVTKDRWSTTALPMERCGTGVKTGRG